MNRSFARYEEFRGGMDGVRRGVLVSMAGAIPYSS